MALQQAEQAVGVAIDAAPRLQPGEQRAHDVTVVMVMLGDVIEDRLQFFFELAVQGPIGRVVVAEVFVVNQ